MNLAKKYFAVVLGVAVLATSASAMPTTVNVGPLDAVPGGTATATEAALISDGTSGTVTATLVGTGPGSLFGESFTFTIDGVSQTPLFTLQPGLGFIAQTFTVSGAFLASATSDGFLNFGFTSTSGVPADGSFEAALNYNAVPEPTTFAMLGIGAIVGCSAFRRRRTEISIAA